MPLPPFFPPPPTHGWTPWGQNSALCCPFRTQHGVWLTVFAEEGDGWGGCWWINDTWYQVVKKSPYDADYRKANQRRRGLTTWFCCTVMVLILVLSVSCSCWSWYTEQWASGLSWWELGLGTRKTLKWSPSSGLMFCHISVYFRCSFFLSNFSVFESTIDLTTELYI